MVNILPQKQNTLPWWTWVLPGILTHIGTQMSIWSHVTTGSSLFYFPISIALILTYWWGPRVLLGFYLNAAASAALWGLQEPLYYPLYALPEVLFVFLSWLLFIKLVNGKCWLPNITHVAYFLLLGLVIPLVIYKMILESLFVYFGEVQSQLFWKLFVATSLGDFISIFGFSVPVLYLATGLMTRNKLTYFAATIPHRFTTIKTKFKSTQHVLEIALCLLFTLAISQALNFADYWYLYGILSLYVAIRFGFGFAIVFNSYILVLTYFLPSILYPEFSRAMIINNEMVKIQLGSALLYVFSTVTGRVMSDAGALEKRLSQQNKELEQANRELDRFVYSVSHDLSAPLKSIMGLVNISRLEKEEKQLRFYIDNIESSVHKLENFINEILDYSRNERQEVILEDINLSELCGDILDNLKYQENFNKISIDLNGVKDKVIHTDKMRLKIILNNLLSNAIKFQRSDNTNPYIQVRLNTTSDKHILDVEDNGEGIKPDVKEKIFEMFFRGTQRSKGSGLGLYIAQEATEKIQGKITVNSEFGRGTVFHVELKK